MHKATGRKIPFYKKKGVYKLPVTLTVNGPPEFGEVFAVDAAETVEGRPAKVQAEIRLPSGPSRAERDAHARHARREPAVPVEAREPAVRAQRPRVVLARRAAPRPGPGAGREPPPAPGRHPPARRHPRRRRPAPPPAARRPRPRRACPIPRRGSRSMSIHSFRRASARPRPDADPRFAGPELARVATSRTASPAEEGEDGGGGGQGVQAQG